MDHDSRQESGQRSEIPILQNLSGGGTVDVIVCDATFDADADGPGVATFGGNVDPIGMVAKRRSFKPIEEAQFPFLKRPTMSAILIVLRSFGVLGR